LAWTSNGKESSSFSTKQKSNWLTIVNLEHPRKTSLNCSTTGKQLVEKEEPGISQKNLLAVVNLECPRKQPVDSDDPEHTRTQLPV